MRALRLFAAAAMGTALFVSVPALAVPVLDQSNPGPALSSLFALNSPTRLAAQTFTVGIGGSLTSADAYVDVRGAPAGNLILGVFATSGGAPTGGALTGISLVPGSVVGLTNFDFPDIPVIAGDVLALVLSSPGSSAGNDYLARPKTGPGLTDTYAAGEFLTNTTGSWVDFSDAPFDLIFATYVDAAVNGPAVPEPGTIALIGTGLLGYGFLRRRKSK